MGIVAYRLHQGNNGQVILGGDFRDAILLGNREFIPGTTALGGNV